MAKRKKTAPKTNKFTVLTAEEATLASMPKYNGFALGHGAHGSCGYDCAKQTREFKRSLGE